MSPLKNLTSIISYEKYMNSNSLKGVYEKWFFFQLWVNRLAMKVTFLELRYYYVIDSLFFTSPDCAGDLVSTKFIQAWLLDIYIDTYHIWIILVMVMSYFDRFSLDSHLLLKKVEIEFGVTSINSDWFRDKWLLNCYTV